MRQTATRTSNPVSDVEISIDIEVPPARVWRALCDPAEVGQWDSGVEAALDAPADYPLPGQHVRWRCRSGFFHILHDRPQEVLPEQVLRSDLRLGFHRYDETYRLEPLPAGTRLTVNIDVKVQAPFPLSILISHLHAVDEARLAFGESLQNIKRHCEAAA